MTGTKHKALFLDRDGVVNQEIGYLHRPEEVRFVPGIFELCRQARQLDYRLVVITNQSGIARGFFSEEQFHSLMEWMFAQFASRDVPLDRYYFCPHHPVHGIGRYQRECPDRKPGPGMLLQAATELDLSLAESVLVGDRCSDIGAAMAAGIGTCFLMLGTESADCAGTYHAITDLKVVTAFLHNTHAAAEPSRQPHIHQK